jgi:hypothetical protein
MITKLALIYQISARCKKLVAVFLFIDFTKLVHALQYLSGKLAPRYNYIPDISTPLQMHSGH